MLFGLFRLIRLFRLFGQLGLSGGGGVGRVGSARGAEKPNAKSDGNVCSAEEPGNDGYSDERIRCPVQIPIAYLLPEVLLKLVYIQQCLAAIPMRAWMMP